MLIFISMTSPGRLSCQTRKPDNGSNQNGKTLSQPESADGDFEQPLTPRERDVIVLLAEGLSNKEIGHRLGISLDTAKFHVGRVIDKLDATGRTDAVAHAARRGVVHL